MDDNSSPFSHTFLQYAVYFLVVYSHWGLELPGCVVHGSMDSENINTRYPPLTTLNLEISVRLESSGQGNLLSYCPTFQNSEEMGKEICCLYF